MKESYLEKRCCAYAEKEHGVISYKIYSSAGAPDRIFLYKGRAIFIEFKKEGGKVSSLQKYCHDKLRKDGFKVFVIDDFDVFKNLITFWVDKKC